MSILRGASFFSTSGFSLKNQMNEKFGPKTKVYKMGEKVYVNGQVKYAFGYFGAAAKTIANFDPNRPTYLGSKKCAQGYAKNRAAASGDVAKVVLLVGDRIPKHEDFDVSRFEGYAPLSAKAMGELNVQPIKPEEVTNDTQVGLIANMKRMGRFIMSKTQKKPQFA